MTTAESLTAHLASLSNSESEAHRHPFLVAAGDGTLSHDRLAYWLSQDRIYAAHAYPLFIGRLISRIPFSSSHALGSPGELKNQRILKALSFSLENVVREVAFFEETSKKWGLPIDGWAERKATRDYTAEMARMSGDLEDGLVFLWAMEKVCYQIFVLLLYCVVTNSTLGVSRCVELCSIRDRNHNSFDAYSICDSVICQQLEQQGICSVRG